jgi:extracellular factor (EF) 3-hydroxypalmitic acid methyl ester biosynthesis protein
MTTDVSNIRKANRKRQSDARCRFDKDPIEFHVFELSARGFSFLCTKDENIFKRGVVLERITILNAEQREIIVASGIVVHSTEFDAATMRIGVSYTTKRLDRTITGKIRVPRRFPKVRLDACLETPGDRNRHKIRGFLKDFTATTARVIVVDDFPPELEAGDDIEIEIRAEARVMIESRAIVLQKRGDGKEFVVLFQDQTLDVASVEAVSNAIINRDMIFSAFEAIKKYDLIANEYKALICDWRMYFERLKHFLDQEERKYLYSTSSEQEIFLVEIEDEVFQVLGDYLRKLNTIADQISKTERPIYKDYFSENLDAFIRRSPLGVSIIEKDCGYPGDFETIKQFFQNPYRGDSLFGQLINKFICSTDAVNAHQERILFLYGELCKIYESADDGFSFLSLGSGPAEEVLRFVENTNFEKHLSATLIDMDAYALADFSDRLQYLPKENISIELINMNILNIIKKKDWSEIKKENILTYCAGLLDYFSDRICKRLVIFLLEHTIPGGTVIITNVHKNNTTRHFMDYAGGWEIIHRDETEMEALVPSELDTEMHFDRNRANIYLKITVPGGTQ